MVSDSRVSNSGSTLPSVLVVDDNRDNIAIMRDFLTVRGYPVTVAYDGLEALRLYEEVKPSIVLLDVMMPGKSGWEVCRMIKAAARPAGEVRVIMVTALDQWEDKRQALLDGADDYLEKPFGLADLAATVERNAAQLLLERDAESGPGSVPADGDGAAPVDGGSTQAEREQ